VTKSDKKDLTLHPTKLINIPQIKKKKKTKSSCETRLLYLLDVKFCGNLQQNILKRTAKERASKENNLGNKRRPKFREPH